MTAPVLILRGPSTDMGTPGALYIAGNRFCFTLELPERDNVPQLSRIPGDRFYDVAPIRSPHFGHPIYHVKDVPGRSHVLQHSGCFAGDVKLGYKTHVLGCQLLAFRRGTMDGQLAVWNSRPAVSAFMKVMDYKPYRLEIRDG